MIDARAKTIVVLMLAATACVAVLGVIGAFVYALLVLRLPVPDMAVNGFWVAVVAILGLVSSAVVPFLRDYFARTQRQLTQDKIQETHEAVKVLQATVDNGLAANVSGRVTADAAIVAAQLAHDHPLDTPVAAALDENTAALTDATNAIDANTAAQTAKDGN